MRTLGAGDRDRPRSRRIKADGGASWTRPNLAFIVKPSAPVVAADRKLKACVGSIIANKGKQMKISQIALIATLSFIQFSSALYADDDPITITPPPGTILTNTILAKLMSLELLSSSVLVH